MLIAMSGNVVRILVFRPCLWIVVVHLAALGCSKTESSPVTNGGLEISPRTAIVHRNASDESGERIISFKITNRNSSEIHVAEVIPSCGCTIPEKWPNGTLLAGESRELHVQLSVPEYGTKRSVIRIRAEHAGKASDEEITINMEGLVRVVPHIQQIPTELEIRSFVGGEIASREFIVDTIEKANTSPWLIGFSSADANLASVTILDPPESSMLGVNERRRYRFRVDAILPNQLGSPRLTMVTPSIADVNSESRLKPILVRVERQPEIRCVPSALFFADRDLSDGRNVRALRLVSNSGVAFESKIDDPTENWIKIGPDENASDTNSHIFRVHVTRNEANSDLSMPTKALLRIRTTLRSTPVVEILVTVAGMTEAK